MKKIPLLTLILAGSIMTGNAQVANYAFSQQNLAYNEITGGTVLWSGSFDDQVSSAVTIPEFVFNEESFTTIFISANGFITFGLAPTGGNYNPINNHAAYKGAVAAFGRDLNHAASGSPSVRHELLDDVFVVQYTDVRRYNVADERISFQIRLNTADNSISVVYGGTITPGLNTIYPQVGLRGASNTDFNNRRILIGGSSWINSLPGTANNNSMYFNNASPETVPHPGLTFTWGTPDYSAPPNASIIKWPPNELTTFTGPTQLEWTGAYSANPLLGYKVYFDTSPNPTTLLYDGPDPTFQTQALQYGTNYYWKVVPYNENGDAPNVQIWSFSTVNETQLAESFEDEWFPPLGWSFDTGFFWTQSLNSALHGNKSAYRWTTSTHAKLHTPRLSIAGNSKLSFFAGTATSLHQRIQLYYSPDKIDWQPVGDEISITPGEWQQYTIDLAPLAGNDYYLGLAAYYAPGVSGVGIFIDHVIGPEIFAILPEAAEYPEPSDESDWVPLQTTLKWRPGMNGGTPAAYKLYFGTDGGGNNTPGNIVNGQALNQNSFDTPPLQPNTTYYWQIIPTNSAGDAPNCPIWSFSTFPDDAIQIGFGDEDWTDLPIDVYYSYSYTQSIYLQQEIGVSRWINKIAYHWDGFSAAPNSSDWVIYLGHTNKTSFAGANDWVPTSQMLKVFDGMVNIPAGPVWIEIELDTPFLYNNTDNLVIAVDENTPDWDSGNFMGTWTDENRSIGAYDDWNNYDPDYPPSGYLVDGFPNTRLFLSETGPPPQLGVNPMIVDFGFVGVDEESELQTISITNIGGGLLLVNSIELAGLNAGDFELTVKNALPLYIYTYDDYEVEVTFKPLSKGNKTASLLFVDNTAGKAITEVELYGFGEPIDPPQPFEATTQGLTSILLEWEKNTNGHEVMIATSTQNNIGEPVDGTEYLVGNNLPGGGVLIYKGPLESFLHSGLVSGSAYYYKAWSLNELDKYSFSVEAYASTFCNQLFDIPIVENFEDIPFYQLPVCWRRIIGEPAQWGSHWIGATPWGSMDSEWALTFYNSYENDPVLIAVTPELNADINTLSIRFKAICPGRKSSNSTESITVGVLSDPTDASTFVPQKTFSPLGDADWTVHKHYFNNYVGNAKYIGIKANYSMWSIHYIHVDDLVIDYLPTCFEPIELSVSNITYNSVDFSWQAQSGETTFEVRGGPTGFDVENQLQGFSYYNLTGTSLNIQSLEHSTTYDLYVRANCGLGDLSEWSGPITFNTLCLPMAVPVEEDFDDFLPGEIPLCWSVIADEYSVVGVNDYSAYSPPNAFALWNQDGVSDGIYLISPELSGDISTMYLKFFAKRGYTSMPIIIGTMSDHTDGSTFQASFTQSLTTIWQQYTLFFNNIPEDHRYIAFKVASYGYIDLDDILIDLAETCMRPTHLRLESAGSGSATLSWLPGTPGDNSWEIKYGQPGFNPADEGNLQSGILSVPYTLINLNPVTSYHAYVRTVCGQDISVWTGPIQFTTLCSDQDRCNYSVIMTDSWGDGWDGTVLGFKQNGVIVGTFGQGFTNGYSYPPVNVPLCPDLPTQIVVVAPGGYTNEKGFKVYDPDGALVYEWLHGTSFSSSTVFHIFYPSCGEQSPVVPDNTSISNETVLNGEQACFNALQVITVAGNGTYFDVMAGGSATLIAGEKISMLPGTTIHSGAYLHAYITANGLFCDDLRTIVDAIEDDPGHIVAENAAYETPDPGKRAYMTEMELSPPHQPDDVALAFRVFPNPSKGFFNIEISNDRIDNDILLEIYNLVGVKVWDARLPGAGLYPIDISSHNDGVYIIRVSNGNAVKVVRLIKT